MRKRFKLLSLIISLLLVFSIIIGCSSKDVSQNNDTSITNQDDSQQEDDTTKQDDEDGDSGEIAKTGLPIVKEKLIQKMVVSKNPDFNPNPDMWFFKEMEKRTNINFDIEAVSTEQWEERKNLMFAANELPDVIVGGLSSNDVITYSQAGQLRPITDLLDEYAPNYKSIISKYPESAKLYAPDGNIYGFATIEGENFDLPGARCFINTKWLENLGLEMPETYDDFYNVLVAFRDQDPDGNGIDDTIPLSGYVGGYTVDPFVAIPLGIPTGWGAKSNWMIKDDKVVFVPTDPIHKEYLARMKKLYDEKLLDQEYFTQNDAQMRAKGEKLLIGAYQYAAHFLLTSSTDPEVYGQYEIINPLTSEYQPEKVWYGDWISNPTIFITTANENPEATARYFDYLYTEEGAVLLYGPEEGQWEGEGGIRWNEDRTEFEVIVPEGYVGIWDWLNKEVSPIGVSIMGAFKTTDFVAKEKKAPEDAHFKQSMLERVYPYLKPGFPSLYFTIEEQEQASLILNDINTYVQQMEAKFILGEEPLDKHDEFINRLKEMGLDKLVDIYQAAYDRYKEHMN